jgi:hypothetical protein
MVPRLPLKRSLKKHPSFVSSFLLLGIDGS